MLALESDLRGELQGYFRVCLLACGALAKEMRRMLALEGDLCGGRRGSSTGALAEEVGSVLALESNLRGA